jgi:hypothetical protein
MPTEPHRYLAYMLRLWQASSKEMVWRASLESPHTGERHGFASLDDLISFLRRQTGAAPGIEMTRYENGDNQVVDEQ